MNSDPKQTSRREPAAAAALSAGALLLAGTIAFVGAGAFDRDASANQATKDDGYSTMVTRVVNRDIVFVVDDRSERLLTYDVRINEGLVLLSSDPLAELFSAARAQAASGRNR